MAAGWLALLLVVGLLAGFAGGWLAARRAGFRSPGPWATFAILLAGSLGGPAVTYTVIGATPPSYIAAVFLAGVSAGVTFWPMGERQGSREWL
jgi:hypothetical protein